MTCIAWDGTTLAADSMSQVDGLKLFGLCKLAPLSDGSLAAMIGTRQCSLRLLQWIEDNHAAPAMPDRAWTPQPTTRNGTVMRVCPSGELWIYDETGALQTVTGPMAMGSGRDYALAAMACGRTAAEAVAIAMRFDASSGGEVHILSFEDHPHEG